MKQMNQIIIEGNFLHYTSKKGAEKLTFLIENKGATSTEVHILVDNLLAKNAVIENARYGRTVRIVGALQKSRHTLYIRADHIEFFPKPRGAENETIVA